MPEVDEISLKIREIFSILTQGIEVVQYIMDHNTKKSKKYPKKILWMDSDIYRVCINDYRQTIAERAKGQIPPGLYLRDFSEIRPNFYSQDFTSFCSQLDTDCCLSIIGTEKSISIEFPTKFARDWFYERFELLMNDVLTLDEMKFRKYKIATTLGEVTQDQRSDCIRLKDVFSKGIELKIHSLDGSKKTGVFYYKEDSSEFCLQLHSSGSWTKKTDVLKINLYDIAEVRPGSHSYGFVKTNSTDLDDITFTIVSTENIFHIEVINKLTRDTFVEKLFLFVLSFRKRPEVLEV